MKKWLLVAMGVIVLAGGVFLWLKGDSEEEATTNQEVNEPTTETEEEEAVTRNAAVVTVSYTDEGFSETTLGPLAIGTTVKFVNNSSSNFQPASNPHLVHTDLSGFDAGRELSPGESYSFVFNETGNWGFHNHFQDSQTGTIIIE